MQRLLGVAPPDWNVDEPAVGSGFENEMPDELPDEVPGGPARHAHGATGDQPDV